MSHVYLPYLSICFKIIFYNDLFNKVELNVLLGEKQTLFESTDCKIAYNFQYTNAINILVKSFLQVFNLKNYENYTILSKFFNIHFKSSLTLQKCSIQS